MLRLTQALVENIHGRKQQSPFMYQMLESRSRLGTGEWNAVGLKQVDRAKDMWDALYVSV